jgi:hypothetical protein
MNISALQNPNGQTNFATNLDRKQKQQRQYAHPSPAANCQFSEQPKVAPMLLSVQPPPSMQSGFRFPHEYSQLTPSSSKHSPPDSPRTLPSVFESSDRMSGHRGLPPPAGMQLPPPDRQTSAMGASLGALPAPPSQWQGQDHPDSMRNWLNAKAEEDRRKQEEEKTRQETMRLDQRKIEQSMLRESLQGGIPPVMVPLIFAGMGGGNLPNQTLEWAQQYMAQMSLQNQQQQAQLAQEQQQRVQQQQAQQQQQQQQQQLPPSQHMSPDVRRDGRMIPPNPYGGHQPLQPAPPPVQQLPQLPPPQRQQSTILSGPTSAPRPNTSSGNLSRLNTTEPNAQLQQQHHDIQPHIGNQPLIQPHPLQPAQPQQQPQDPQPSSSGTAPGLFFHHWTPPSNSNGIQPPTPSGKSAQGSPFAPSNTHSHLRSEYQASPKKRKTGPTSAGGRHTSRDRSSPHGSERSRSREQASTMKRRQSRNSLSESSENNGNNYPRPSSQQRRNEQDSLQRRRSESQGRNRHAEGYRDRDGEREPGSGRGPSEMRKEESMDMD